MQPELPASRIALRPFTVADAPEVQRLAGDALVAETTLAIPHPYPDGAAEDWISSHEPGYTARREITYAIALKSDGKLLGAINLLAISVQHSRCEIGFWVGREYWSRGFCTEAAERLTSYAKDHLGITRIAARCLARNGASARVMVKLGMQPEGRLVQHVLLKGIYEDVLLFGLNLPGRGARA